MRIGFFTDTYFPQINGVSTSIKLLRESLRARGHTVYLFTSRYVKGQEEEEHVYRVPTLPFPLDKNSRIALPIPSSLCRYAKELHLDLLHSHTEFSMGMAARYVAKQAGLPLIHTFHILYEDWFRFRLPYLFFPWKGV